MKTIYSFLVLLVAAVMINGGKVVHGYTEHFITVDQEEVVGD